MIAQDSYLSTTRKNLSSAIVVSFVALPLCLGIALASGAPLISGIISGIIGGIVVGFFSQSHLGVSGPAVGLAAVVLHSITLLESFEVFLLALVFAGIIQIVMGFLRAGIIGYYFPSAVVKGMLSGIGLILILKQIPHAVGYDADYEADFSFYQQDGYNTFSELYHMLDFITIEPILITLVSMTILIVWERPFFKKAWFTQIVQGPLVVVITGSLMGVLLSDFYPGMELISDHKVTIPQISFGSLHEVLMHPDFGSIFDYRIYTTAITIAVIGSLETLLCLEATDKMDVHRRITPANRELKAQGIGNVVSGLLGGIPITQVIVRSSVNIQSGATTKLSSILHGFLILIGVLIFRHGLNLIPLASLASILFVVGYKLANPKLFKNMYRLGWSQFIPFVTTIVVFLLTDLLVGVTVGMVVAIFYILLNNYKRPYFFNPEQNKKDQPNTFSIRLSEEVSFLNKALIMKRLNSIPSDSNVIIDASNSVYIDIDVLDVIRDFCQAAKYKDITVQMLGDKLSKIKE